jgi:hypothetical protein
MSDREFWVANSVQLQNRIVRWLDPFSRVFVRIQRLDM